MDNKIEMEAIQTSVKLITTTDNDLHQKIYVIREKDSMREHYLILSESEMRKLIELMRREGLK